MRRVLSRLASWLEPTYGQKLSLLAAVPVILAASLIALVHRLRQHLRPRRAR
jgi:hypothetical protein